MKHPCQLEGKLGELLFICSRCRQCYVCRHKAICSENGTWMWKSFRSGGKFVFESVIHDARVSSGAAITEQQLGSR